MKSTNPDTDMQDPDRILSVALDTISELYGTAVGLGGTGIDENPVAALSVTGQVHGILYVDHTGKAVSPLYTWQDGRGRKHRSVREGTTNLTWVEWAYHETGHTVPSGYGLLTHCINVQEKRVPATATCMTTILGYLAMRFTGTTIPRVEYSDAHPLGLHVPERGAFDTTAAKKLGISTAMIPETVPAGTQIAISREGIPVLASVGDNQAGYIGAVRNTERPILVNVGTSAQLSIYISPDLKLPENESPGSGQANIDGGWLGGLEIRPFPGGGSLLSGVSLSGGSAYGLLEALFRKICMKYTGSDPGRLFDEMNAIPYDKLEQDLRLHVGTQFLGTRRDVGER